jgi:quercetin dioxygenase-like cupin family protein
MTIGTIAHCMANGIIVLPEKTIHSQDITWTKHPTFEGVYLKHLIGGDSTNGQLSCHLVRIDPGCTLKIHTHAAQWELHEVIEGAGSCSLDGHPLSYETGRMVVIPSGTPHAVTAGDQGLVLLAKFFPALL